MCTYNTKGGENVQEYPVILLEVLQEYNFSFSFFIFTALRCTFEAVIISGRLEADGVWRSVKKEI